MAIRAIATDIDATLTDEQRRISLTAVEELRKAEADGRAVILVSGNVLPLCLSLTIYLGLSGPIVAENGGVVFWRKDQRLELLNHKREPERGFEHLGARMPLKRVVTDRWRETEVVVEEKGVELSQVQTLLKEGGFDLRASSTRYGIHIMEASHSKLRGLRLACSWLGIGTDDVLAMGDSESDTEFLEGCGYSGVPANGTSGVRAIAGYVAGASFGEGAVEIMRHFGII